MNDLQIFQNEEFGAIRTINKDGEPWLVGKDVATALGYSDTYGALKKHVDLEDKQNCQNDSFNVPRGLIIINESGLYSLILSSKLPTAKKFKRWVTAEVLPAIRKTGKYELVAEIVDDDEPQQLDLTQLELDQRIKIASIVASCRRERLALVAKVLSIDIDEITSCIATAPGAEKNAIAYIDSVYESLPERFPIKDFYIAYQRWCLDNNLPTLTKHAISKVFRKYYGVTSYVTSYCEGGQLKYHSCRVYEKKGGVQA